MKILLMREIFPMSYLISGISDIIFCALQWYAEEWSVFLLSVYLYRNYWYSLFCVTSVSSHQLTRFSSLFRILCLLVLPYRTGLDLSVVWSAFLVICLILQDFARLNFVEFTDVFPNVLKTEYPLIKNAFLRTKTAETLP